MIRVLVIAYHFPPIVNAGIYRTIGFVKHLPSLGFLPLVLAGPRPLHPEESGLLLERSLPNSVQVYHVKNPALGNSRKHRNRVERWLGLRSSTFTAWNRAVLEVCKEKVKKVDLIFATMSPFESSYLAYDLSRHFGVPWVADLRDPWALDEVIVYPTALHRKIEKRRMKQILSTASLIIMNTPEATRRIVEEFYPSGQKYVCTVTNGYDEEDFGPGSNVPVNSKFRIVHSGGFLTDVGIRLRSNPFPRLLGGAVKGVDLVARSPAPLLGAIKKFCDRNPNVIKEIEIIFAGRISGEDLRLIKNFKHPEAVKTLGHIPRTLNIKLLQSADLLFLPMHYLPPGRRATSIPGKLYEYMAARRPILASVPSGDARDFLIKSGTALICKPGNVSDIAETLGKSYLVWKHYRRIKVRPNEGFITQFERRNLTERLASVLAEAL